MNLRDKLFIHRGRFNSGLKENSLDAFRKCVNSNYNIELDLHILKDNTVIVFHDDNLKRIYKKDINLKTSKYKEFLDYSIPTLEDVLSLVNGKVLLDIELKYDVLDGRLEEKTIEILSKYNGEFILKSFHPLIVLRLKRLTHKKRMNVRVGMLIENTFLLLFSVLFIHPSFIAINYKCLNKRIFRFISKRMDTLLYNIKTKENYLKYKDKGYGIILENYKDLI